MAHPDTGVTKDPELQPGLDLTRQRDLLDNDNDATDPLTKRWWFWAGAGAVAATIAVVSYAVVRSTETPEQAPFDGGTLGWTVPAALRF